MNSLIANDNDDDDDGGAGEGKCDGAIHSKVLDSFFQPLILFSYSF